MQVIVCHEKIEANIIICKVCVESEREYWIQALFLDVLMFCPSLCRSLCPIAPCLTGTGNTAEA